MNLRTILIVSNLPDNAIEACEKTDMEQRLIKVKLHTEFNRITISVRNPAAEAPIKNGEKFETTKSDKKEHGIGLTNVEQTVMKYGGECISSHSKVFLHIVLLSHSKGGAAKSSHQMIERYPCSISTN